MCSYQGPDFYKFLHKQLCTHVVTIESERSFPLSPDIPKSQSHLFLGPSQADAHLFSHARTHNLWHNFDQNNTWCFFVVADTSFVLSRRLDALTEVLLGRSLSIKLLFLSVLPQALVLCAHVQDQFAESRRSINSSCSCEASYRWSCYRGVVLYSAFL